MFPYPLLPSFCIVLLQNPHVSLGTHLCFPFKRIQHSAGPSEQGSVRTFFKLHKKGIFSYEHLDFVKGVQLKEVDFFLYVAQYTLPARSNVYHSSFPLTVFDIRCAIFLAFSLFPEMNGYYWRILSYKFIKTIYFANM